jgi:hypothetical protein
LGILRDHPRRDDVFVTMIEQDRRNADFARESARETALTHVTVVVGDAGDSRSYVGIARASLVIMVGFLTHIGDDDLGRLVAFLPQVSAAHGGSTLVRRIATCRASGANAHAVGASRLCSARRCVRR